MEALRNIWYVAAWPSEIGTTPLRRTLLEEQIAFFRQADGRPVALGNICPHRFAPLHRGKIVEDTIECPYHGLRFNAQGRCVFNPDLNGAIPATAQVRSYPLVERGGLCWIWMGDPKLADEGLIVDFPFFQSGSGYRPVTGYLHVRANYRYMIDNLVDVSHVLIVHHDMLACPGLATGKQSVERDGNGIWVKRFAEQTTPPKIFDMMWRRSRGDYDAPMDHWAESKWNAPSLISQNTGVQLSGLPRDGGLETKNFHLVTPESETSSHYFWAICRNFETDNDALDVDVRAGTEYAFVEQDEKLLEALQENMNGREFWSMKPALMVGDAGAVQVRRETDRLLAAEKAATARAPADPTSSAVA